MFEFMDIQAFLQLSCGRWLTQQTCHQLGQFTAQSQTAQLNVELLEVNDAEVVRLCCDAQIDPTQVLCAAKLSWQKKKSFIPSSSRWLSANRCPLRQRRLGNRGSYCGR
ncbi:MAG: phycobiliprotein lyase [Acaryochloridaceae cyanobacterium CSU_3_4]|nr:phycobiliprotein lyase [Acaryochloridaceae cyanobacterium CSU_3_4]